MNDKDCLLYLHFFTKLSCQPVEVIALEDLTVLVREVYCGPDGTMFLTDVGSVYACGNNEHNKLGLNNRQGFLMAMKNIFTKVSCLPLVCIFIYRTLSFNVSFGVTFGFETIKRYLKLINTMNTGFICPYDV